ncbi:carboxypeptidase-like regulatory domain-containing protein [Cellulomonas soli]|uniref:alpha-amylase n=1 Tax=Cellulomonas soli TaxID=931535 RepID=A0A512PDW0_9CELL|nr:carboxypeptidase-like regulatory domain-containing protein [Cellulomonas soli]NYI59110.1 protocatechuate 3,4-dioxygenase beta subunit [Cellulomonas soli]GEP69399.1 hypothetical protein CSO01_21140 [Cellulomonas soli]
MVRLTAVVGAFCLLVTAAAGSPARADERHASAADGGKVVGRVTDTARRPVVGARVEVLEVLDPDGETRLVASATTGKDGRYTATAVSAGTYRVHVIPREGTGLAAQYQPAAPSVLEGDDVTVRAGRTTRGVDVALRPESQISGVVRDANGDAVPGIQVTADLFVDGIGVWISTGTTTTTASGGYTLRGLPAGIYRIGFESLATPSPFVVQYYPGVGTTWQATGIAVAVGKSVTHIDATLAAPAQISGAVTNESGAAIPGTRVTAYAMDGANYSLVSETLTADDGSYVLGGLAPGGYRVSFSAPASYTTFYPGVDTLADASTLTVEGGGRLAGIDARFVLGGWADPDDPVTGGILRGTVSSDGGAPVVGVDVTAFQLVDSEWGSLWYYAGSGVTGLDGSYEVAGVADGTYRLGFGDPAGTHLTTYYPSASDVGSATSVQVVDAAVVDGLDVRMSAAGVISGTVTVAGAGEVPPTAYVSVYRADEIDGSVSWSYVTATGLGTDGAYRIGALPSGTYRVGIDDYGTEPVYAPAFYPASADLFGAADVVVTAGSVSSGIDVVLTALAGGLVPSA